MADAERLDHGIEGDGVVRPGREPAPEQQILPHAEMREQLGVLKHQADAAAMLGDEQSLRGVDQHAAVEHDRAAVGVQEARDEVDGHRLARAGAAEQRDDAVVVLELYFEIERTELERHVDPDHSNFATCLLALRCTISETTSAPSAMIIATMVSRMALASPPGTWV